MQKPMEVYEPCPKCESPDTNVERVYTGIISLETYVWWRCQTCGHSYPTQYDPEGKVRE